MEVKRGEKGGDRLSEQMIDVVVKIGGVWG